MFKKHQFGRGKSIASILTTAALCVSCASLTPDSPSMKPLAVYGSEGTVSPYTLFLGTPANWGYVVPGNGTLDARAIKVRPTWVGNSKGMEVTWVGSMAQVFLQSSDRINLTEYANANGALVFDAIVHKAPQGAVEMRVDCGYPCRGTVNMTKYFRDMPLETQETVKIPLACFAKTGVKFAAVNTPWLMFTENPFTISLANIRWEADAGLDRDAVACAK